jgi:DNA-binding response OmpR family regulator
MTPEPDRTSVLIVEDEESIADMYEVWLEDMYDVSVAHTGETALKEMADGEVPDVVLLDRRMPGTPGDEVADEIEERGYNTQVIMVTAVSPSVEIASFPIDDYVTKPVKKEEMHEIVETAASIIEYEEAVQEIFALMGRKQALVEELPTHELESSEEFTRLESQIEELREATADTIEELVDELGLSTFQRIEHGLTEDQVGKTTSDN